MKISGLMREYFDMSNSYEVRSSRIFESMPKFLPIEPKDSRWNLSGENQLLRIFEFSNRENLKDFVQAVLDLEDEMMIFSETKVSKDAVQILVFGDSGNIITERSRKFSRILDEFYKSLSERS